MTNQQKKQTQIHVKCDVDLAREFKETAIQQGYSQSLVLRELMKEYVEKNKQIEPLK